MKEMQIDDRGSVRVTGKVTAVMHSRDTFGVTRPPFEGRLSDVSYGAADALRVTLTRVLNP